jgi:hypothetical protein
VNEESKKIMSKVKKVFDAGNVVYQGCGDGCDKKMSVGESALVCQAASFYKGMRMFALTFVMPHRR